MFFWKVEVHCLFDCCVLLFYQEWCVKAWRAPENTTGLTLSWLCRRRAKIAKRHGLWRIWGSGGGGRGGRFCWHSKADARLLHPQDPQGDKDRSSLHWHPGKLLYCWFFNKNHHGDKILFCSQSHSHWSTATRSLDCWCFFLPWGWVSTSSSYLSSYIQGHRHQCNQPQNHDKKFL